MGNTREAEPARLFMSLIATGEDVLEAGLELLRSTFGKIDWMSESHPFDWTDYYEKEMGPHLIRRFLTFEALVSIPRLPEIKLATNRIEDRLAKSNGNRRMNIDPGYLCLQHLVLATTKGYTHRPYLRDGIYADLTLIYKNGSFRALEWTYPDYRQADMISQFNELRTRYVEALRQGAAGRC